MKLRVKNYGATPYGGWLRTTTDFWPDDQDPGPQVIYTAVAGKALIVPGRMLGIGARTVDVKADLPAGAGFEVDLSKTSKLDWQRPQFDPAIIARLGVPMVNGEELRFRSAVNDGAAHLMLFSRRIGRMLNVELTLWAYPDQPGWACGELTAVASNPLVPDVTADIPTLSLTWGNALVRVAYTNGTGFQRDDNCMDGQGRSWPVTFIWPQNLVGRAWNDAGLAAEAMVQATALSKLYSFGGRGGFPVFKHNPVTFVNRYLPPARLALLSWDDPPLGVEEFSGTTGAQEDQLFPGGECDGLPGGIQARYEDSLSQWKRPCHHLEANGEPLRISEHPELVIWNGRAHGTSRDKLGKSREITRTETAGGWWGPDNEHFLLGSIYASYRLTGSASMQRLLHHHANLWLGMNTVRPGLATSSFKASRAVVYEGLAAWLLYTALEDRGLADQIMVRVRERCDLLVRGLSSRPLAWHTFKDVLGPGDRWMPWQQALGAWGLDLMGKMVGHQPARDLANVAAEAVLNHGFEDLLDGRWEGRYSVTKEFTAWSMPQSTWMDFGFPCAIALLWQNGNRSTRLLSIRKQMLATGSGKWWAPWDECWNAVSVAAIRDEAEGGAS